mmetsp:Transcript_5793/g.18432  ORF Transcript_5793/g.18432 Transcript_5793/m.18432 type:complete len:201 (+) Transcript_5793:235-837(+)
MRRWSSSWPHSTECRGILPSRSLAPTRRTRQTTKARGRPVPSCRRPSRRRAGWPRTASAAKRADPAGSPAPARRRAARMPWWSSRTPTLTRWSSTRMTSGWWSSTRLGAVTARTWPLTGAVQHPSWRAKSSWEQWMPQSTRSWPPGSTSEASRPSNCSPRVLASRTARLWSTRAAAPPPRSWTTRWPSWTRWAHHPRSVN